MRLWFFADGGRTLVASAECRDVRFAQRLAIAYNRDPGRKGPIIDVIADAADLDAGAVRVPVPTSPRRDPHEG